MFALQFQVVTCLLLLFLALAIAGCGQRMTAHKFRELVATHGDNVPLLPILTNGSPVWTNVEIKLVMEYANGQRLVDHAQGTSKTIGGRFIVHTMHSELNPQPVYSIFTYDEQSGQLKEYGLYKNKLAEATITFDEKAKTYAATASYAGGFTETSTGSWSDTEDISHSVVNQNGKFFMVRDSTIHPVSGSP